MAPVLPTPRREGHFNKDDLEINLEEGYVRCPAGQETKMLTFGKDGRGRKVPAYRAHAAIPRAKTAAATFSASIFPLTPTALQSGTR
ncbi:MAG TPA: hypothetical protein GX513_01835 [Firmicutes bacterium]|nr:hypothetical protein [Bacillota bacterium]